MPNNLYYMIVGCMPKNLLMLSQVSNAESLNSMRAKSAQAANLRQSLLGPNPAAAKISIFVYCTSCIAR
jgi:hypothetical protein